MFLSLHSVYFTWHLTDVIIPIVLFQNDPDLSLEESTTLNAPADIQAPECTLDSQHQGDNEDSDDERNRLTPSTSASTSASAKKRYKREANESACEALGVIQDYVLHKRTKTNLKM